MGETTYNGASLSDIAAMMNGNGANNWANNPFMYLLFLAFFGNGGFGFNRNGQGLQDAELLARVNGLGQQISDNQNTNNLGAAIAHNGDHLGGLAGRVDLGFAGVNSAINNAIQSGLINAKDLQAALQSCCCQNQTAILNQTNQLQGNIENTRQAVVNGFANIGYALAQQTNELNTNATNNTRAILDKMCADTTQGLRDKLAEMSQEAQTAKILASVGSGCGCN